MNEIDKNHLYGKFQAGQDWRAKLGRLASYKALDIDDPEMQINANRVSNGVGAKGLIGVALASSAIPAALLGSYLWNNRQPAPAASAQPTPIVATAAQPYLFDEIEQRQQPDGTWKATGKVVRKRLNSDGTIDTIGAK